MGNFDDISIVDGDLYVNNINYGNVSKGDYAWEDSRSTVEILLEYCVQHGIQKGESIRGTMDVGFIEKAFHQQLIEFDGDSIFVLRLVFSHEEMRHMIAMENL